MTLTGFVLLYMLGTVAIGVFAATRVRIRTTLRLQGAVFPSPWS